MSNCAIEKARSIYQKYAPLDFPLDIEKVVNSEGCELITWPLLYPVKEVKRGCFIGIAAGLGIVEHRYLAAHALAHHLLHSGNQLAFFGLQMVLLKKQEREADICAAHILIPEAELMKLKMSSIWEVAEYFGVPEELAKNRINNFATEEEKSRWSLR